MNSKDQNLELDNVVCEVLPITENSTGWKAKGKQILEKLKGNFNRPKEAVLKRMRDLRENFNGVKEDVLGNVAYAKQRGIDAAKNVWANNRIAIIFVLVLLCLILGAKAWSHLPSGQTLKDTYKPTLETVEKKFHELKDVFESAGSKCVKDGKCGLDSAKDLVENIFSNIGSTKEKLREYLPGYEQTYSKLPERSTWFIIILILLPILIPLLFEFRIHVEMQF